jgi:hypothetical protein
MRSNFFTARIEEPAAADRREDERHGERSAENSRAQIARQRRDGATRPECHSLKRATVCAQRQLSLRAAVDVVKDYPGKAPFGGAPQIFDVDYMRRLN